jgi:hypothetical protein
MAAAGRSGGAGRQCPICCDDYSLQLRAPVSCVFCDASACRKCVEKYLLSVSDDPHCMMCRRQWSAEFVDEVMTKSFRTSKLKEHRENLLLDRERSMLPATQPIVENIIKEQGLREVIRLLTLEKATIDAKIRHVYDSISRLKHGGGNRDNAKRDFVKPCVAEGCRGFLSTQYKCGICKVRVCPDCHEIKRENEQHACNPDVVASVAMIARDSRACPKCGSMIHRVSGCSQMYCTAPGCRTAFDWNTGRIVQGRIHNPHYYEFMRQQQATGGNAGRELDDIPCGGMPTSRQLMEAVRAAKLVDPDAKVLVDAHRLAIHVHDVEIRYRYPAVEPTDFDTNRGLRVKYLMGSIDDHAFKRTLQMQEKHRNKLGAINQILAMFTNVAADMYRNLIIQKCDATLVIETLQQLESLRVYVNASLEKVSQRFTCVVPFISSAWILSNMRHT